MSHNKEELLKNFKELVIFNTYEMLTSVELLDSIEECLEEIPSGLTPCPSDLGLVDSDNICMLYDGACEECWKCALEKRKWDENK